MLASIHPREQSRVVDELLSINAVVVSSGKVGVFGKLPVLQRLEAVMVDVLTAGDRIASTASLVQVMLALLYIDGDINGVICIINLQDRHTGGITIAFTCVQL